MKQKPGPDRSPGDPSDPAQFPDGGSTNGIPVPRTTTPKTIVITGSSDGIGAAAARRLRRDGHEVVVIGRSPTKTASVARELDARSFVADFARLDEVRELASALGSSVPRIDVLANNAGGLFGERIKTVDGFEKTLQVNHLAPFLLTNLLMPTLIASRASVIQTSSNAARISGKVDLDDLNNDVRPSATAAYGDAKLANILFTTELHARFHEQGLSAAAFHPGTVATNFASDTTNVLGRLVYGRLCRRWLASPDDGAGQLVWLAEGTPGDEWQSGEYYEKYRPASRRPKQAADSLLARQLWDATAELVGLVPT
jgi:NAD(P)-dependent dehydrogenase (short-subunit alcohol dehydrogenase family)